MNWLTRWRIARAVDQIVYLETEAEKYEEMLYRAKSEVPGWMLQTIVESYARAAVLKRRVDRLEGR